MFKFTSPAVVLCYVLFLSFPAVTYAYPFGAGGCSGNQAAVGAPHRFQNYTTGSLATFGFVLSLDSVALRPGSTTSVAIGTIHTLKITATTDEPIRGYLFRLAGGTSGIGPYSSFEFPPFTDYLFPVAGDTNAQYSVVCANDLVGGVTHTNPVPKASASANLFFPAPAKGFILDVTVVVENEPTDSEFFYSEYKFNAVAPKAAKGAAPTKKPKNMRARG